MYAGMIEGLRYIIVISITLMAGLCYHIWKTEQLMRVYKMEIAEMAKEHRHELRKLEAEISDREVMSFKNGYIKRREEETNAD